MRHQSQFRSSLLRFIVVACFFGFGCASMSGCLNDEEMIDHHEHVLDQEDE